MVFWGWVKTRPTAPSIEERKHFRESQSKLTDGTQSPWLTFSLLVLSSRYSFTAHPLGRLLLMFSSGCLAKNINTHLGGRRVRVREETEVTTFILVLLITDPVTRYFVQQGTMFLKSILSCQMVAITQWKGLSLGGSHVRHVWAVEGPKEPSIWTCCCRLLEVAWRWDGSLQSL